MWENTIYELADSYNATINVCVKLCRGEKGRGVVLQYPVCSVLLSHTYGYTLTETPLVSGAVTGRKLLCIRKILVHTLLNRVSIKGWDGTTSFSCLAGWIQA